MSVDWMLVATIAAPVGALFVGAILNHFIERRAKLVSFLAHASAVTVVPPDGPAFQVHTHSIAVRNVGHSAARNVRIGHEQMPPNFSLYPPTTHQLTTFPGGGSEITIPALVPGEQVVIAYLYYPPLTWHQVNKYVKFDEGFAKIVSVLLNPPAPRWRRIVERVLIVIGLISSIYVATVLLQYLLRSAS